MNNSHNIPIRRKQTEVVSATMTCNQIKTLVEQKTPVKVFSNHPPFCGMRSIKVIAMILPIVACVAFFDSDL